MDTAQAPKMRAQDTVRRDAQDQTRGSGELQIGVRCVAIPSCRIWSAELDDLLARRRGRLELDNGRRMAGERRERDSSEHQHTM